MNVEGKNHECDRCHDITACERNICRAFELAVPVTVIPRATVHPPEVNCRGDIGFTPCHVRCEGGENKRFEFTITQIINLDIPIEFGAEVCFGDTCATSKGECHH